MEQVNNVNDILLNEQNFLNALQIYVDGRQGESVMLAGKYIEECLKNKTLFVKWSSKVIEEYLGNHSNTIYTLHHISFLFQMLRLCLINDPFNFDCEMKEQVVKLGLICSKKSYVQLAKDPSVITQFNTIMNAFCCYYLVIPYDTDFIRNFGEWFLSEGENYEFLYLTGLNYLFEELANKQLPVGDNRRTTFKIIGYLYIQNITIFIELILNLIFDRNVPDETLEVACDFIMDLMMVIERSFDSFISMGAINTFVDSHFDYVVELSKMGDSMKLKSICRLLVEKAEASRFDIVDNLGNDHESFKNFEYINFIAKLGVDYADMTLPFWGEITEAVLQIMDELEENDLVERTNIQTKLSGPLKEYYKILISKMMIDEDQVDVLTSDHDEDLYTFRNNITNIIGETSNIVGVTNTLELFYNWLRENSSDWRMSESIIFMISVLGYDVVQYMEYENNDYVVNMLKQLMSSVQNVHPQMIASILELIREFIEMVSGNIEIQQLTLAYISQFIADQRFSQVCCKIFEILVSRGKLYDINCLEAFLQLPLYFENAPSCAYQNEINIQTILCALSLMISQNFEPQNFVYFLRLLETSIKRLEHLSAVPQIIPNSYYGKFNDQPWKAIENDPCLYFHRITSVTKNINFYEIVLKFPETKIPIQNLEFQLWSTMKKIMSRLEGIKQLDNATRVVRIMLRQGSSLFREISIETLRLFLERHQYPFMYIVSVAIDVRGDELMQLPEFYNPLKALIKICIDNFNPDNKEFLSLVDVVDDFYRLIKKLLHKHKKFLLSLAEFDKIILVAIAAMQFEEFSDYECHVDILDTFYGDIKEIPSNEVEFRSKYESKLNEHMQYFLNIALHTIIFKLYRIKRCNNVCDALYSVFRYDKNQFFEKFRISLSTIPNTRNLGADESQKLEFISQLNLIETKNWSKHRFNSAFQDFAKYYN
ncbi:Armadillo-type fold domain-containing protein [Strongyloides ratti]|uniref:Armadillo-type fold domain-containing protein n=1 Tax=Strongyloides ratti TaxID=34506 RepID=A0A090LP29_STRRB|nr:Armadillo-type fold domain-containing protein [Strongyloides ratti]CEF69265.1 Armadillo-type fold domain-containing protein [Strongyloides ratti]